MCSIRKILNLLKDRKLLVTKMADINYKGMAIGAATYIGTVATAIGSWAAAGASAGAALGNSTAGALLGAACSATMTGVGLLFKPIESAFGYTQEDMNRAAQRGERPEDVVYKSTRNNALIESAKYVANGATLGAVAGKILETTTELPIDAVSATKIASLGAAPLAGVGVVTAFVGGYAAKKMIQSATRNPDTERGGVGSR